MIIEGATIIGCSFCNLKKIKLSNKDIDCKTEKYNASEDNEKKEGLYALIGISATLGGVIGAAGGAGVDRKHHVGQEIIHHTQDNGTGCAHDLDLGQADHGKQGVK